MDYINLSICFTSSAKGFCVAYFKQCGLFCDMSLQMAKTWQTLTALLLLIFKKMLWVASHVDKACRWKMEALVKFSNLNIAKTTNWETKEKCIIMGDNITTNHGFLKGSN